MSYKNHYQCRKCGRKVFPPDFISFKFSRVDAYKLQFCPKCYLNSIEDEEEMGEMMQP